jgi:type III pantothenate kinase
MKVLAIDAGNSRIKWGLADDGAWMERGAVDTAKASDLTAAIARLPAPERVVIANVAGEIAARDIDAALDRYAAPVHRVLGRAEQCGVRSSYANPEQLGPDRWAALIGARHRYDGPCLVVNAGTTMTVDALSSEGVFLGGFIVAGYSLMRQSLSANTARLRLQDGGFSFFPDNTGDAIASGALNSMAGAVDRMALYMTQTGEGDPAVLLSGGDASVLAPLLEPRARVQVVDNLVLEGLLCIGASDV